MQLPDKSPMVENAVVTSADDLAGIIRSALQQGSGAFLKVFTKGKEGKYYLTLLVDRTKVLAAEGLIIDTKRGIVGEEAISVLKSALGSPMVVDAYSLDEIELKLSIAENVDAYSQTPKLKIEELFGGGPPATVQEVLAPAPAQAPEKELPQAKPAEQAPQPAKTVSKAEAGKPEVVINLSGGSIPEKAFQTYAEYIMKDAKRIRGLTISRIEFDANVGEGVVYLNVRVYGNSSGTSREIEVAEKRMLHAVSKYAPVILREAEIKPIIRDVSVVIDGQEVKPQEIVDRDKKKTGNVTRDGRITLSVLEDVWPYFSNFARTVVGEIEGAGIKVTKAYFDVRGRREFEINLSAAVETNLAPDTAKKVVTDILNRHAKELGRSINRYISVHNVDLEFITSPTVAQAASPQKPVVASGKAAEILAKKAALEAEVEKMLKEAGLDELAVITEEKKKESEETVFKSRIEPAVETLKNRIHAELKLVPRVTFKWLKLNHEVRGSTVYVDIEASFLRENVGGLFGSFSGVSDDRIKQDITETIKRVIRDVSREYSVGITLRKLNIILR